jgi:hypothetical protein
MHRSGSQRGQTLPVIVLFMFGLLGMCALAIDVGSWYQQKQLVANAADAGALAGAASLPTGWSAATTTAGSEVSKNVAGATVTYTQGTTFVAGDSITVTVTKPAQTYFASLFTKNPVTVKATATATMMNAGGGALPWGVMDLPYVPGQTYPIYTDNSGPNNGALRVPAWDTGTAQCTTGTANGYGGASLYQAEVTGGILTTCPVTVGEVLATKTGQNTGPTQAGVASRCSSLASPTSVVSFPGVGSPTILQPASCQLVLLPTVVDDATGNPVWPIQGSQGVRVTGFSWWVISGVAQGGKEVDAVYVGPAPITSSSQGNTLPGAYQAQLTG